MQVYNSFSKQLEDLKTFKEKEAVIYVCGLTPYDSAHIGHTRTYVAFDIIKRYLISKEYKIFHIQNITDVDDKIIKRCKENSADPKKLTETNHDQALEAFDSLNIIRADFYPKVTEHIKEIIDMIEDLIAKGYAYETKTGIYYKVSKFKDYGKLSGQKLEEIKNGTRVEVDKTKESAEDFALWKKTNGEIIEFDSAFGKGRPGWHIECSAIVEKYAKRTLDIHGGARDLMFPHHENEIAQSEAATGKKLSKYWLHTGFLTVDGEKMSKSLGNFIPVKEVLSKFDSNAIRLFFIQTHYRSAIDYNEDAINAAGESAERIFNALGLMNEMIGTSKGKEYRKLRTEINEKIKEFYKHMDNDFDTPQALASLFDLVRIVNSHIASKEVDSECIKELTKEIEKMLWIFGLQEGGGMQEEKEQKQLEIKKLDIEKIFEESKQYLQFGKTINPTKKSNPEKTNEKIDAIIEIRDTLRLSKNYKQADMIRARLAEIGILVEDKDVGRRWKITS